MTEKIEFRSMFAREFDFHSTVLIASSNKEGGRKRKLVGNGIQIDGKRNDFYHPSLHPARNFLKLALERVAMAARVFSIIVSDCVYKPAVSRMNSFFFFIEFSRDLRFLYYKRFSNYSNKIEIFLKYSFYGNWQVSKF